MGYTDRLTGYRHSVPLVSQSRRVTVLQVGNHLLNALENIRALPNYIHDIHLHIPGAANLAQVARSICPHDDDIEHLNVAMDCALGSRSQAGNFRLIERYLVKHLPQMPAKIEQLENALEQLSTAFPANRLDPIKESIATIKTNVAAAQTLVPNMPTPTR